MGEEAMMALLRQAELDTARSVGERIRALERCSSLHDAPAIAGRVMSRQYQNGLRVVSPLVNVASTT
ncbi:hypothetical protein DF036_11325 [Burkholderia contaminans]|nr:hypothetical protein DF036_11325 [Burkholderia contaminans]